MTSIDVLHVGTTTAPLKVIRPPPASADPVPTRPQSRQAASIRRIEPPIATPCRARIRSGDRPDNGSGW